MQLKNNMARPFKAVVCINAGQTVDKVNTDGEVIGKKPAQPILKTIQIGIGATAEIDDAWWHVLWDSKGQGAGEIEENKEEHFKLKDKDNKPMSITRKEVVTTKTIFNYRNMVKNGALEIIEKAKPKQSQEQQIEMIRDALGLKDWKPKDTENLEEMFNKVVG